MSSFGAEHAFYRERIPEQFNRTLARQRERARTDADAARVLEEMEAVRTSIVVEIDRNGATDRHVFDIERGVMRHVETPGRPPFLILGHAHEDFENLRRECGDSLLGFLGSLAGLGEEMRLTSQRVRSLRELRGSLVFERTGPGGFKLFASFGMERPEPEPRATIRLDDMVHARLRSGELDPQDAFMDGLIEIRGDMEMAIGLALAALSPE
ncbi:MAG TPA: hypothetical protein ENI85_07345 [Deltaproteobacteria bacterium]|nr:hypothetical protein [Deltaproteobacteria bacterium]